MTRLPSAFETAGAMKVADSFEPGAVIGPLIDMKAGRKGRGAYHASATFSKMRLRLKRTLQIGFEKSSPT
jgi:hypothetical protein